MLKPVVLVSAAVILSLRAPISAPALTEPDQLPSGCYRVVGPEGDWGITLGTIADGNSWTLPGGGGSGTLENGQIRIGRTSHGTVEIVDLDDDGIGDVADLDFVGLPSGMPTHYTLEPCLDSPQALVTGRNPFEVISEP